MKKLFLFTLAIISQFGCIQLSAMDAGACTQTGSVDLESYPLAPKAYQDILQEFVQIITSTEKPDLIIPSFPPIRLDNTLFERMQDVMATVDNQIFIDPLIFVYPYGFIKTWIGRAVMQVLQVANPGTSIAKLITNLTFRGTTKHEPIQVALILLDCHHCLEGFYEAMVQQQEAILFGVTPCASAVFDPNVIPAGQYPWFTQMAQRRNDIETRLTNLRDTIAMVSRLRQITPDCLCEFHKQHAEIFHCTEGELAPTRYQRLLAYATHKLNTEPLPPIRLTERLIDPNAFAQVCRPGNQIWLDATSLRKSYGIQKISLLHECEHTLQPLEMLGSSESEHNADMQAIRNANCYQCVCEFAEGRNEKYKVSDQYLTQSEIIELAQAMDREQLCDYHKEYRKRLGETKIHHLDWLTRKLELGDVEEKIEFKHIH